MALILNLKYVEHLRGKTERLAKVSFRGVSHYTKIVENVDDTVWFDESFEWPVARPIESEEIIDIQLYSYNKYLSNRRHTQHTSFIFLCNILKSMMQNLRVLKQKTVSTKVFPALPSFVYLKS
ncbi:otoferlin-like [Gigantopelta aegis]|uniref:otoferlin-like n=1 Tax=Gigantopelta aegis TaxID=1735272 RepID=UPI001B88751D|nr:otoferlin-like [Gigantopelta aegis]